MCNIYAEKFAYAAIDRIEATAKVFDDDEFVVRTQVVCEGQNISSVAHDIFLENACATSCEDCLRLMLDGTDEMISKWPEKMSCILNQITI